MTLMPCSSLCIDTLSIQKVIEDREWRTLITAMAITTPVHLALSYSHRHLLHPTTRGLVLIPCDVSRASSRNLQAYRAVL
jgi:hypothetical protein